MSWSWQYSPGFSFSAPSSLPGRAPFLRGCPPPLTCVQEGKPWCLLPQEVPSSCSRHPRGQQGLQDPWIWLPSQNWFWGRVTPGERNGLGFIHFTAGPGRAHHSGFLEPPGSFLFHPPLKCELFQEITSNISQSWIFFLPSWYKYLPQRGVVKTGCIQNEGKGLSAVPTHSRLSHWVVAITTKKRDIGRCVGVLGR